MGEWGGLRSSHASSLLLCASHTCHRASMHMHTECDEFVWEEANYVLRAGGGAVVVCVQLTTSSADHCTTHTQWVCVQNMQQRHRCWCSLFLWLASAGIKQWHTACCPWHLRVQRPSLPFLLLLCILCCVCVGEEGVCAPGQSNAN